MPHRWDGVITAVARIADTEPDDEFDGATILSISAAFRYAWTCRDLIPPDGVFPLPDGGLMFEWRYPGGEIRRMDFPPDGGRQLMTTYADGRPPVFASGVNHLGVPRSE